MLIDFRIIFYFSEKKLILDFGYCMVPKSELSTGKVDVNAPAADVNRDVNRGKLVSTSSRKVDVNRKLIFDGKCGSVAPSGANRWPGGGLYARTRVPTPARAGVSRLRTRARRTGGQCTHSSARSAGGLRTLQRRSMPVQFDSSTFESKAY